MKAQGADLRLGRAEWKPETSDVRLERADLMPMRTDLKLGRDNLRPCCLRGLILGLRGLIWGFRAPNWGRRGLILGLTRLIWCLRGMIWGLIDLFEAWEASFEADLGGGDGWRTDGRTEVPPFSIWLYPLWGCCPKKKILNLQEIYRHQIRNVWNIPVDKFLIFPIHCQNGSPNMLPIKFNMPLNLSTKTKRKSK